MDLQKALEPVLHSLGLPRAAPFAPAYPADVYLKLIDAAARTGWPNLPFDEAHFELGKVFMRGLETTFMGRAVLALMRVAGPRRSLERVARSFRTANNYTQATTEALEKRRFRVTCECVHRTGFYRGILHQGLEVSGAQNVEISLERYENEQAIYDIRWR